MPRKILYKGTTIFDQSLVVGNHGDFQIVITGNFSISGLVFCPKCSLELVIRGNGKLDLHGICKTLSIKKVRGDCLLDCSSLAIGELKCLDLNGKSTLKVGLPKIIREKNIGKDAALILGCEAPKDGLLCG